MIEYNVIGKMYTLDLQEMNQIHIDLFVTFSRTKIYLLTTKIKLKDMLINSQSIA